MGRMLESCSLIVGSNVLRIIAGSAKGRHLLSVPGPGTRPITDRVKEALFSMLAGGIEGATFLDLFAGTGSVGIEALSRGAARALFVDRSRKAVEVIHKNLAITGLRDRAEVLCRDSFRVLSQLEGQTFDYIYVAPPQYQDLWSRAMLQLDASPPLTEDGVIIVQIHPKEYRELELVNLHPLRDRHYGSTALYFYGVADDT